MVCGILFTVEDTPGMPHEGGPSIGDTMCLEEVAQFFERNAKELKDLVALADWISFEGYAFKIEHVCAF